MKYDNEYRGSDLERKSSSAYFTTPTTAAMLTTLALSYDKDRILNNPKMPVNIYDFACGAGILLIDAARRINSWGVCNAVHLYGVDINMTSLETCKRNMVKLESESYNVIPHIYRAPYGQISDGSVKSVRCGSLEAMRPDWTWAEFELVYGSPAPTLTPYQQTRQTTLD